MDMTGLVLDQHDDTDKGVLGRIFPNGEMPALLKKAAILSEVQLSSLPNDAFALCVVDDGRLIRKFATIDPAATALSVVYFLDTKDQLPELAQKAAAANLVEACHLHDLGIPGPLASIAEGAQLEPVVDISGQAPPIKMAAPGEEVILDSHEKVASACEYLDEHFHEMHPRERHSIAVPIRKLAEQYKVSASDRVLRYGSENFAPSLKAAYQIRKDHLDQDDMEGLALMDGLFSKAASANPEKFAEALAEMDKGLGLNRYWDIGIPDPWYSTFGFYKTAEYVYQDGNDRVTGTDLERLAQNSILLNERFEADLVSAFKKDPITIFDSLPRPQKTVIARIASDQSTNGANLRHAGA